VPSFSVDVRGGIAEALLLRPDYRSALLDLDNRHITVVLQKNLALPRLDLQASLSLLGFDNDFGTSLDRVPRRDQSAWTVGAIFSVPIPNRAGRGAVIAAQLSAAQALVNLQKIEQQIVVDVDNASGQIVTARQRIASTREASKLARESLDAGELRLKAGTSTTFVVLEFQKKLAEAQSAELRAQTDYNKAVSEYHRQTGTALRMHGVVVQ
jgi:outer membrane protein TolC